MMRRRCSVQSDRSGFDGSASFLESRPSTGAPATAGTSAAMPVLRRPTRWVVIVMACDCRAWERHLRPIPAHRDPRGGRPYQLPLHVGLLPAELRPHTAPLGTVRASVPVGAQRTASSAEGDTVGAGRCRSTHVLRAMDAAVKLEDSGGACGAVDLLCRERHPGGAVGADPRGEGRLSSSARSDLESEVFFKRHAVNGDDSESGPVGQRRRRLGPELHELLYLASMASGDGGGGCSSRYGRALSRSRRAVEAEENTARLDRFLKSDEGVLSWRVDCARTEPLGAPALGAQALLGMSRTNPVDARPHQSSASLFRDQKPKVRGIGGASRRWFRCRWWNSRRYRTGRGCVWILGAPLLVSGVSGQRGRKGAVATVALGTGRNRG